MQPTLAAVTLFTSSSGQANDANRAGVVDGSLVFVPLLMKRALDQESLWFLCRALSPNQPSQV